MLLRPCLVTATCFAALALPGGALAAPRAIDVMVPCVQAAGASVGCDDAPVAVPTPTPAPVRALPCPGQDVVPTRTTLGSARTATLCLVDRERRAHGLRPLRPAAPLAGAAAAYAKRMARDDFFDHTAPNGSTFIARIKATSYLTGSLRRWSVGENLAWGTGQLATPQAIVKAWMASPGHRRNILTPAFDELGLGIAIGAPQHGISDGDAATYVNEFGQRLR